MIEMPGYIQMEPFRAEDSRLQAAAVRHGNDQLPPRLEQFGNLSEHGRYVPHMLQGMPHRNAVESSLINHQRNVFIHFQAQFPGHDRVEFRPHYIPAGPARLHKKRAVTAADIKEPLAGPVTKRSPDKSQPSPAAISGGETVAVAIVLGGIITAQVIGLRRGVAQAATAASPDGEYFFGQRIAYLGV